MILGSMDVHGRKPSTNENGILSTANHKTSPDLFQEGKQSPTREIYGNLSSRYAWNKAWLVYYPICSMYSIFTYIWAIYGVNVGKYSIHGAYGYKAHGQKKQHPLCVLVSPTINDNDHRAPRRGASAVPFPLDICSQKSTKPSSNACLRVSKNPRFVGI